MPATPLVSFILITYNQSKFVREAIRGALAQDYANLEIIISDDRSPDDTWQVIQDEVAANPTRHKVIVSQTPRNLGLAGNVNAAVGLSSGEWLVMAAGDDISLPHRVSTLIAAAQSAPSPVLGLGSQYYSITENGEREPIHESRRHQQFVAPHEATVEEALAAYLRIKPFPRLLFSGTLTGATAAWHRSLFERFGPLPDKLMFEDAALTLRARLIGRVLYLPDRLIEYRKHADNLSNYARSSQNSRLARARKQEALNLKRWSREAELMRSMHRDLSLITGTARDRFLTPLKEQAEAFDGLAAWWSLSWFTRLRLFPEYRRALSPSRVKTKHLLPSFLYLATRALTLKAR